MRTMPKVRLGLMELLGEDSPRPGLEELKNSVRANLSAVLNTRRLDEPVPPEYEHCAASLLSFGLPDFTSFAVTSHEDRELLGAAIETAIRRFEPRLAGVMVTGEPSDPARPRSVIHYRIDAWLAVEPAPQPVAFDTMFETGKWHFLVVNAR